MTTAILFVWNPLVPGSWDTHDADLLATQTAGSVVVPWKAGTRKQFEIGERVFVFRTQCDRGIVAAGRLERTLYHDLHWDGSGAITDFVDLRLDSIVHDELPVEVLQANTGLDWNTLYGSGRRISADLDAIEALWDVHVTAVGIRQTRHSDT